MRVHHIVSLVALAGCASGGGTTTAGKPDAPATVRVSTATGTAMAVTLSNSTDANVSALPYSVDDVWRVLPAVYDSLGIPITLRDGAKRVIGNDGLNIRRRLGTTPLQRYLDCGNTQGAPSADTYEIHMTMQSVVSAGDGGGSKLSTVIEAMGKPVAFSGEFVRCGTTGALEKRIAESVNGRLRK
jgi:hypothetical protein